MEKDQVIAASALNTANFALDAADVLVAANVPDTSEERVASIWDSYVRKKGWR